MAKIQDLIHHIEQGRGAKWVRIIALCALCFFLAFLFVLDPFYRGHFKGITHPTGMEQAAIAKEIAKGNGFASAVIRPLSLVQMKENGVEVPEGPIGDTYMAPGWPTVLAPVMFIFKGKWELGPKDDQYFLDRVIVTVSFIFFFLGVWINYYTIRRLFDEKLAMMAVCLTLLAAVYWQYASSGLPQMWLFFVFSATVYALARALHGEVEGSASEGWLALATAGMGVLTLSLSVCFTLFVGSFAYFMIRSPRRLRLGLIMGGVYLACIMPWMIRNWSLSGNPFGVGLYSTMAQVYGSEGNIMRRMSMEGLSLSPMAFRAKVQSGIQASFSQLYTDVGGSIPACLFLLSFLHRFRNPVGRRLRWLFLCMWGAAIVGMAFFQGSASEVVQPSEITLLFIPIFAAFGMAYLLVQWGRLEIGSPFFRRAFIGLIFGISAIPLLNHLTASGKVFFVMPYRVPSIARLEKGAKPNEVVASDMPWAVAWYANRTGLLFPIEPATLIEMHDYGTLKRPIAGLFLTSISSDTPFLTGVLSPELRGWYGLLRRDPEATSAPNLRGFPFPTLYVSELFGYDCFYTDKVRADLMKLERSEE